LDHQSEFVGGVCGETIKYDDRCKTEDTGVFEVLLEIGKTTSDGIGVGVGEFFKRSAALVFKGADCSDEHEGVRPKAGGAALQIKEFLAA
jgi:hypothetical protein